jgi:hypothetical protein
MPQEVEQGVTERCVLEPLAVIENPLRFFLRENRLPYLVFGTDVRLARVAD